LAIIPIHRIPELGAGGHSPLNSLTSENLPLHFAAHPFLIRVHLVPSVVKKSDSSGSSCQLVKFVSRPPENPSVPLGPIRAHPVLSVVTKSDSCGSSCQLVKFVSRLPEHGHSFFRPSVQFTQTWESYPGSSILFQKPQRGLLYQPSGCELPGPSELPWVRPPPCSNNPEGGCTIWTLRPYSAFRTLHSALE